MSENRRGLLGGTFARFELRFAFGGENRRAIHFVLSILTATFLSVMTTKECLSADSHSMSFHATRWKSRYLETCRPMRCGDISLSDAGSIGLANCMPRLIARGPLLGTLSSQSKLQSMCESKEAGTSWICYSGYRDRILLAVREAYWDAAWRQEKLDLAREKLAHKEAVCQIWDQRIQVPRSETCRRMEADMSQARAEATRASQLYSDALQKLKDALRVSPASLVWTKDELSYGEEIGKKYRLDELLHRAVTSRIDPSAKTRIECLRLLFGLATRNTVYAIDTAIIANDPSSNESSNEASSKMDHGIKYDTAGIMDAIAEYLAHNLVLQENELGRVETSVAQDVVLRWIDFDTDIRSVGIARDLVSIMQRNFDDCQNEYVKGEISVDEESKVSEYFFQSRESLLDATYRLRLTEARLLYASGSP